MALTFPTTSLKKPSGVTALPSGFKRPAFGTLYGFDAQGGGGGAAPAWNNDYSLSFDGTNNYVDVGNVSALNFERTDAFSVSGWVKRSSSVTTQIISSKATNASPYTGYLFYINTSYQITLNINVSFSSNYLSVSGNTTLNTSWNHVCVTYDGSSNASGIKLYVNGNAETTSSAGQTSISGTLSNSYPVNIGSRNNGDLYFNGLIDEVAIFNSALTASNVTAIYNSGTPVNLGTGGLNLSPVGWWRMGDNDSGTGTTVTDQGSGSNDGTLANGPTFSSEVPPGYSTKSIDFDGTDDYMSIADADIFSMGNGLGTDNAFSISAWFNASTLGTAVSGQYVHMATKDASAAREWAFRTYADQLHFFAHGTGGGYIGRKYTTNLNTGQWYHAVVTYDASKASSGIKLYLNGTRVDDADYAVGTFTASKNTSTEVRVGGLETGPDYSDSLIDEVAIFNAELSASNVTAIYNSGTPVDLGTGGLNLSPVGWWRMGDGTEAGSGTTVYDMSSNSNNGTLGGGPTYSSTTP